MAQLILMVTVAKNGFIIFLHLRIFAAYFGSLLIFDTFIGIVLLPGIFQKALKNENDIFSATVPMLTA